MAPTLSKRAVRLAQVQFQNTKYMQAHLLTATHIRLALSRNPTARRALHRTQLSTTRSASLHSAARTTPSTLRLADNIWIGLCECASSAGPMRERRRGGREGERERGEVGGGAGHFNETCFGKAQMARVGHSIGGTGGVYTAALVRAVRAM